MLGSISGKLINCVLYKSTSLSGYIGQVEYLRVLQADLLIECGDYLKVERCLAFSCVRLLNLEMALRPYGASSGMSQYDSIPSLYCEKR